MKNKYFWIFISIIFAGIIIFVIISNDNNPNYISQQIQDNFSNSSDLHWTHMPITYSFSNISSCGQVESNYIIWGFNQIQGETNNTISFKQIEYNGDIIVNCKHDLIANETQGTFQLGDAQITNLSDNKIVNAELNFFIIPGSTSSGSCSVYPTVEIHEILHTFGFVHTDAPYNIMNPVMNFCPTHLNENILNKLLSTYKK